MQRENWSDSIVMLDLVIGGNVVRFDELAYRKATGSARDAADKTLDDWIAKLCLQSSVTGILRAVMAIAMDFSALRHRAATGVLGTLLSEDRVGPEKSRLALLIIMLGLMDVQQNNNSIFRSFILCISKLRFEEVPMSQRRQLVTVVALRLMNNPSLGRRLTPALACTFVVLCIISRLDRRLNPRLADLRTVEQPPLRDLSWPLALRLGLFLFKVSGSDEETNIKGDLAYAVLGRALVASCRERKPEHRGLVERARATSPRLESIEQQFSFETDPARFKAERQGGPFWFRHIVSPVETDIVCPSDGSEFIGFQRAVATGEVLAVERDRLTARLRGSEGKRRWNNEPVQRLQLSDAIVSPEGLVLFGDDKILDFEFANLPNRSGSAMDRYHIGSYPELHLSGDRSAVVKEFPLKQLEAAILLSGLPNMENFGHFILNGVSKFSVIRRLVDANFRVIVPGKRAAFQDSIIEYCGMDPQCFTFTGGSCGVRVRRLDVLSEAPMGMWPYNLLESLRADLPKPDVSGRPKRIYVARPEGGWRSLANEDALLELLGGFDVTVVRPETMPFAEQVAALEAADTVIAPHGSALATLVFCRGRKRVVEVETKTSFGMPLYNFLGHEAVRVPSRWRTMPDGVPLDATQYEVDLEAASRAIAWAARS